MDKTHKLLYLYQNIYYLNINHKIIRFPKNIFNNIPLNISNKMLILMFFQFNNLYTMILMDQNMLNKIHDKFHYKYINKFNDHIYNYLNMNNIHFNFHQNIVYTVYIKCYLPVNNIHLSITCLHHIIYIN